MTKVLFIFLFSSRARLRLLSPNLSIDFRTGRALDISNTGYLPDSLFLLQLTLSRVVRLPPGYNWLHNPRILFS